MRPHKDLYLRILRGFVASGGRAGRLLLEAMKERCEPALGDPVEAVEVDALIETASTRAALLDPTRPLDQKRTRLACLALLRDFEEARLGRLIVGRRKHRTRFRFSHGGTEQAPSGPVALSQALDEMNVATPGPVHGQELDPTRDRAKREPEKEASPASVERPRRQEVVSRLKAHSEELRRLGVSRLELFGSVARDEARPDSDVDVLARFDSAVTSEAFFDTKFFLEDLLDRRVDLVTEGALRERVRAAIEPELVRVA